MDNINMLVSIIVPVYNVKDYLENCVNSILNQTYTNIEIILVDDGSTDGSEILCDKLAMLNKKIIVYHKQNGGLSSARNFGLTRSNGEIISFIDSDDYMFPDMINTLISGMERYNAQIVCCDYCSDPKYDLSNQNPIQELLSSSESISNLLSDKGYKCFAWNKIYRKELFDGVEYPVGKLFEDIVTTYLLFKKANKILYIKQVLYFYRIRKGSITAGSFSYRNYDLIEAINTVLSDAEASNCCKVSKFTQGYFYYYLDYVKKAVRSNFECKKEIAFLNQEIKSNMSSVLFEDAISLRRKAELYLFGLFPNMYCRFIKHFFWKKKKE